MSQLQVVAEPEAPPAPATAAEIASWILVALAIGFIFYFKLVAGLAAGLLVFSLLAKTTHMLHGPRLSHGAAKFLAAGLLAILASGVTALVIVLLVGFLRGHLGDLPALFQRMADVVDQTRAQLLERGLNAPFPDTLRDADQIQSAASDWLREHAAELTKIGGEAGRLALHAVMGLVLGVLVFFRHPERSPGPLGAALLARIERFTKAFEMVVFAQVEISALNTVLTATYLFALLPLFGNRLPFSGTLIILTFVTGLIPVAGNLISNSVIVIISLGVSPWTAVSSLVFLIVVHKLEYFVNAKIVGSRIHAAAWEILLAIVVCEVSLGIAGVALAPVMYAYAKGELTDRRLI